MPPAGTLIANQAVGDYNRGGSQDRSFSNTVTNQVLPVYAIVLSPPGTVAAPAYSLTGAGGDTLYCVFDLTNAGNDRDSVAVGYAIVPPSNTVIANLLYFDDVNGNGRFDPGEDDPSFLAIGAGGTVNMSTAVILPSGNFGGDVYIEVQAQSTTDTTPVLQTSVFLVSNSDPPPMTLYLGPRRNPRALPGGEGSSDDLTVGFLDYTASTYVFENDVLNAGAAFDIFEVSLADSVLLPPGIQVSFSDSTGQQLPQSPTSNSTYLLGNFSPGETRPLQVSVFSNSGAPLSTLLSQPLSLPVRARSFADTLLQNFTDDRLMPPQQVNPSATLSINQAFHEQTASVGDVVTLLVTTQNITDSLLVNDVTVVEVSQPQLDFASSPDFALEDGRLVWRAGAFNGGQSKTAVIKFVANGRRTTGTAQVVGNVAGVAESGDPVSAGPAVSAVRLQNDVFASEGVVLGEVYVDENDNSRRDRGEPGVKDVAVFLDSGEYAVTDSLGKFSLPRAFAGWRMIRLDEGSVPASFEFFEPLDGRTAGRRNNEQLIHLLPGGNAKLSFRLRRIPPPTVEVEHAITCHEQVSIARFARLYRTFVVPSSHFALGKARLTIDSARQFRPVVEFLHEHPDWGIFLEGHTDSIPISTEAFPSNVELSVARANVARSFFESMGIDDMRIVVRGYGEARPVATNETIEGRRLNRRVEISLIPPGVRIEDGEIQRVSATIKDLKSLPDTFKVNIRWEISTTSERPADATFRVDLPYQTRTADVRVTLDGQALVPRHGVYDLRDFAKSRELRCDIEYRAANGDTSYVSGIEAVIELDDPAPVDSAAAGAAKVAGESGGVPPPSGVPPRRSLSIRPNQNGGGVKQGRTAALLSWSERVPLALLEAQNNSGNDGEIDTSGRPADGNRTQPSSDAADTDAKFVILEPLPDHVFSRADQIKVRARVPLGGRTKVFVGGEELAEGHMGQKAVHVNEGFEEITWYAVRIRPGWNSISVQTILVDGTTETDSVRVALAARPAAVEAQKNRVLVPADGRSTGMVQFEVHDQLGLHVADGIPATVVDGDSLISNPDARPNTPGLQVITESGFVTLHIKPSNKTGWRRVTIECNGIPAWCDVSYISAVRPMMATGVVDLRVGHYDTGGQGDREGLENPDDGLTADAEARLFLQSELPRGVGLTARLDTEERDEEPHLKQINPNVQYPIYGDESELQFAAPSRNGNYVSVDKDESWLRYGDFRTPFTTGEYLYYHQVATGLTGALVGGDGMLRGFVTDTDYATFRDELKADGTSGFYYLSRTPIVFNSERLFIETRDRFQSEIVVDLRPLVRNRDYTINPFDGSILFKEPVAVTDPNLNPVYIVVVYEVETRDESLYLFGLRGDFAKHRQYNLGATAVANSGDAERYALYGMDGGVNIKGVNVIGEFARSEDDVIGNGNAFRIQADVNNRLTNTNIYYRRVEEDYNNPSYIRGAQEIGTRKTGFKSRLWLWEGMSLYADGFVHNLRKTDEDDTNLLAGADYQSRQYKFFAGGRVATEKDMDGDRTGILSVLGLAADVKRRLEFRTRWENNLGSEWVSQYPDRLMTRLAVPFSKRLRVSATHEYLSAAGRPGTNQFQAGVESRVAARTTAYTRYSMNRTASDERMGAIAGLRQAFLFRNNVTGTLALEGYQSMADNADDEYFAVKTGLSTRQTNAHVIETRYEYRWQQIRSKHNFQLIANAQLQSGFSLLLSDVISYTPDQERKNGLQYRGKLGLAYRPIGLPVQSLFALKNLYEKYTPSGPDAITWTFVLSTDVNVLPAVQHELRLKYAYKRVEDFSYGISVNTNSDLVLGQYIYRFARSWDLDLWGRVLAVRGGTTETGTGVEVGRLFYRTVRVAAGYSYGGFDDPDISGTDAWSKGFGVRIQLILSDWIRQEFGGQ
jgi:flagellar motor protein MotB